MITYATPSQPTGFLQAITSACPLLSLPLPNRSVQSSGMYSQIRLTRLSSTGCFLSSRSPVTSSLQSLYNMKHILAYTSSFVKSRLHIDQPQILHRSFFNDSSCKSINIRFAFPTSPASVCQMSNSGKPGIPIGTSSLRNSILLSVTFLPDI